MLLSWCTLKSSLMDDENLPVVIVWEVGNMALKCLSYTDSVLVRRSVSGPKCSPAGLNPVPSETSFLVFLLWCPTVCFPTVFLSINDEQLICEYCWLFLEMSSKICVCLCVCQVVEHCWWSVSWTWWMQGRMLWRSFWVEWFQSSLGLSGWLTGLQ